MSSQSRSSSILCSLPRCVHHTRFIHHPSHVHYHHSVHSVLFTIRIVSIIHSYRVSPFLFTIKALFIITSYFNYIAEFTISVLFTIPHVFIIRPLFTIPPVFTVLAMFKVPAPTIIVPISYSQQLPFVQIPICRQWRYFYQSSPVNKTMKGILFHTSLCPTLGNNRRYSCSCNSCKYPPTFPLSKFRLYENVKGFFFF